MSGFAMIVSRGGAEAADHPPDDRDDAVVAFGLGQLRLNSSRLLRRCRNPVARCPSQVADPRSVKPRTVVRCPLRPPCGLGVAHGRRRSRRPGPMRDEMDEKRASRRCRVMSTASYAGSVPAVRTTCRPACEKGAASQSASGCRRSKASASICEPAHIFELAYVGNSLTCLARPSRHRPRATPPCIRPISAFGPPRLAVPVVTAAASTPLPRARIARPRR
jgi:hypothetical protein